MTVIILIFRCANNQILINADIIYWLRKCTQKIWGTILNCNVESILWGAEIPFNKFETYSPIQQGQVEIIEVRTDREFV